MKYNIIDILKKVDTQSCALFYKSVCDSIDAGEKRFIVTANPEVLMMGYRNRAMREILEAEYCTIIPDGIGIVKALEIVLHRKDIQRNTGIDFADFLLSYANEKRLSIFVYGAKEEVLQDFSRYCQTKYPDIIFSGMYNGYTYNCSDIQNIIEKTRADIYFIALGTPSQELMIDGFYKKLDYGVCVGIGGSLDVLSGHVKRAPKVFVEHNLEWLYRISSEPKRVKRFMKSNIPFFFLVFRNLK